MFGQSIKVTYFEILAKCYKDLAKKNEGKAQGVPSLGGASTDFLKEKMQLQMKLGVT